MGAITNLMPPNRTCALCAASVPASAPENLCPRCLFDSAFDDAEPQDRTPSSDQPNSLSASFGDYEILGELGRGGQGVVYRARHRTLDRIVALKTIPPTHIASREAAERFRLEASAASRLDHPNIVPIYDSGVADGFFFYSMKLLERGNIGDLPAPSTPQDFRQIARLLSKISQAVHHAHQRGLLHRDLKPSNILLDAQNQPHIADFGLARFLDQDSSLTLNQALLGTPAYLAPEVAAGGATRATIQSDVYALGAILYQLLTSRPPFLAPTATATLRRIVDSAPEPPRHSHPNTPRDLETICLKCLEKDPAKRYPTAQDLRRRPRSLPQKRAHHRPPNWSHRQTLALVPTQTRPRHLPLLNPNLNLNLTHRLPPRRLSN